MNPCKFFIACLALSAGSVPASSLLAAGPAPADAFLDRPLPADLPVRAVSAPAPAGDGSRQDFPMLRIPSFWGGVRLLGALSGKTVRLPAELAEWPDERTEDNWGLSLGIPADGKVRKLFEQLCDTMDLTWRLDPKGDAIDLTPQWERDDPRPGKELAGILVDTRPVRWTELERDTHPNRFGGHDLVLDAWRVAFDALLSRSENFSSAGSVRLYHDSHGHERGMSLHLVDNLCAGELLAPDGRVQILVLNRQGSMTNKEDPGDLTYYLFDEDGRFTHGGVYAVAPGRTGEIIKARIEERQIVTVTFGRGSFAANPVHLHFALAGDELVLQGSTDSAGVVRNAPETQHLPDWPKRETTRLEYRVAAKPGP